MLSLIGLMKACPKRDKTVNLLCGRGEADQEGELTRWLRENGVEVLMRMPSACSVQDFQNAPAAQLNIVTDSIGMKLAREMEKVFGIPYVLFGHYADPQRILACYQTLENLLKIPEDPVLSETAQKLQDLWDQIGSQVKGKSFIHSNSPFISADMVLMLHRYGAKPVAVYVISKNDFERKLYPELLASGADPLVAMLADFSISETLLRQYEPDLFFGRLTDRVKAQTGALCLDFEEISGRQGFEALEQGLGYILNALKEGK